MKSVLTKGNSTTVLIFFIKNTGIVNSIKTTVVGVALLWYLTIKSGHNLTIAICRIRTLSCYDNTLTMYSCKSPAFNAACLKSALSLAAASTWLRDIFMGVVPHNITFCCAINCDTLVFCPFDA